MKQFKKRKVKKRKKTTESNIDEEIIPQKHEREGNLNFYSEEISKQIIEKIISKVISTNFYNNVEKQFNDFCLDEFFKKIDNFVELTHLDHEVDDFNCSEEILSKIKYQKTDTNDNRHKIKIHKNIVEHKNHLANESFFDNDIIKDKKIEDYLNKSFNTKNNVDLVKQKIFLLDIEVKDDNFWGIIPQPKCYNIDRTTSKFNILTSKIDNSNKILEVENASMNKNNDKNKNIKYFLKRKSNIFLDKYINNELLKRQKKYQPILQMPHISIPDDEFNKNEETDEIKKIRKETIELITARQEELKKLIKKNKVKELKKKIKIKKNAKGNFSIDNEGKIVFLKQIDPDSLLREFSPIMSKQKDISLGKSSKIIEKEKLLLEIKAKKNIEYNPDFFHFISNNNITDKLDKDNKEKEKEKEKSNNKRKSKNKTSINNTNIIKEEISKYQPPPLMSLSPRFTPSGSNFEIINPSIGVNIKEKDQVKVGGKNFYEKFHKFSVDEFNKTLHETLEMEIKSKLKGNILKDLNINDIKNIIKEENNLGNIRSDDIKDKKDKIFRKTFSGGFRTRKNMQKSNSDFFNINEKYPVLKEILFHDNNDISDDRNRKFEKSLSNINIFNRNIKSSIGRIANKNIIKYEYNLLNDFNKELIKGNYMHINERKPFLPRLPPKINIVVNNLLNNNTLNKTINNFHRIRQKKINDLVYDLSNPPSANKKTKMKRINSSNKVFN